MKKIAVVGLGIMGHGIADNYLKSDYEVYVWNRSVEKADDLVGAGAILAESPRQAVGKADIIFEVTADDESSRDVWLGSDGILAGASPNNVLITAATLSLDWVTELAQICNKKDLSFFDMPMTGSRIGAESGQLTLFVGGDEGKLEEIKPDLEAITAAVKYFGPIGSGTKYKLVLNTLQAIHIAGFGEVLRMARNVGLDETMVAESLAERPGGVITNISKNSYHNQPNPITFSIEWITKDLNYAQSMSKDIDHTLLTDVLKIYKSANESEYSKNDWTQINEI